MTTDMNLVTPALAASAVMSTGMALGHTLRAKLVSATGNWMSNRPKGAADPAAPESAEVAQREQNIRAGVTKARRTAILWWVAAVAFTVAAFVV